MMNIISKFLNRPTTPSSTVTPEDGREELSVEATWDLVYISFLHSRGYKFNQKLMLEFIKDKFKISKDFNSQKIPEKTLQDTINFRTRSTLHLKAVSEDGGKTLAEIKKTSVEELSDVAKVFDKNYPRQYPDNQKLLLEEIALGVLEADYRYVVEDGSPTSYVYNFLFSDGSVKKKIPGGRPFEVLWQSLKPTIEKLISEKKFITKSKTTEQEKENEDFVFPVKSDEMWQEILKKLS